MSSSKCKKRRGEIHTIPIYFEKEKLLNALKHFFFFLYIVVPITTSHSVNPTGQNLVFFKKFLRGFNRPKNNSSLYIKHVSGRLEAFEVLKCFDFFNHTSRVNVTQPYFFALIHIIINR